MNIFCSILYQWNETRLLRINFSTEAEFEYLTEKFEFTLIYLLSNYSIFIYVVCKITIWFVYSWKKEDTAHLKYAGGKKILVKE